MLRFSSSSDLIRAAQKDEYYREHLQEQLQELTSSVLGARAASAHLEVSVLSKFLYDISTTVCDKKTLGEEYCDIRRVTNARRLPGTSRLATFVALKTLLPYAIAKLRQNSTRRQGDTTLKTRLWNAFLSGLARSEPWIQRARHLHLALFYLLGRYLTLEHRVCGLRYIYTRSLDVSRASYGILGVLIFLQAFISLIIIMRSRITSKGEEAADLLPIDKQNEEISQPYHHDTSAAPNCTLCLGRRERATATDCGHVFCWRCICEWCTNKPECPLCRHPVALPNLVALVNYL